MPPHTCRATTLLDWSRAVMSRLSVPLQGGFGRAAGISAGAHRGQVRNRGPPRTHRQGTLWNVRESAEEIQPQMKQLQVRRRSGASTSHDVAVSFGFPSETADRAAHLNRNTTRPSRDLRSPCERSSYMTRRGPSTPEPSTFFPEPTSHASRHYHSDGYSPRRRSKMT